MSGKEVVRAFENLGWEFSRQSGSHMVVTKDGEIASLSVPNHKEVARVIAEIVKNNPVSVAEDFDVSAN